MNLVFGSLGFCRPFLRRKRSDKKIQASIYQENETLSSRSLVNTDNLTTYNSDSFKDKRPVHCSPVDDDEYYDVDAPKVFFKDDNFLILQPEYPLFSREDDDQDSFNKYKFLSEYPGVSRCTLLEGNTDFENSVKRKCYKRSRKEKHCSCTHCQMLFVINESLKHPAPYWPPSQYDSELSSQITSQECVENILAPKLLPPSRICSDSSPYRRIENTLVQLLDRVNNLEKLTKSRPSKIRALELCDAPTQYSTQVFRRPIVSSSNNITKKNNSNSTIAKRLRPKTEEINPKFGHKTWVYRNVTNEIKQNIFTRPVRSPRQTYLELHTRQCNQQREISNHPPPVNIKIITSQNENTFNKSTEKTQKISIKISEIKENEIENPQPVTPNIKPKTRQGERNDI